MVLHDACAEHCAHSPAVHVRTETDHTFVCVEFTPTTEPSIEQSTKPRVTYFPPKSSFGWSLVLRPPTPTVKQLLRLKAVHREVAHHQAVTCVAHSQVLCLKRSHSSGARLEHDRVWSVNVGFWGNCQCRSGKLLCMRMGGGRWVWAVDVSFKGNRQRDCGKLRRILCRRSEWKKTNH